MIPVNHRGSLAFSIASNVTRSLCDHQSEVSVKWMLKLLLFNVKHYCDAAPWQVLLKPWCDQFPQSAIYIKWILLTGSFRFCAFCHLFRNIHARFLSNFINIKTKLDFLLINVRLIRRTIWKAQKILACV